MTKLEVMIDRDAPYDVIRAGDDELLLPYPAFEIIIGSDHLTLWVTRIDHEDKSGYGVSADFAIHLDVPGIQAEFPCWMTLGNLRRFLDSLRQCHHALDGTAVLEEYGERLTRIGVTFDPLGHCIVSYDGVSESATCQSRAQSGPTSSIG